ncbi:Ig-like domain-containing protein, partial [Dokdonella sp.]|uniref:Ig-like domain-containing protein n=1 Tax=Dokdonella sp. TaxID=2291710 RepID=UPI002F417A5B
MTDRPSAAATTPPRARADACAPSRPHALHRFLALLLALLAGVSIAHADPDPYVFESHAPGDLGGGLAVGTNPVGLTFRLLERTALSEIGVHARGNGTTTVYAALHRLATPETVPDVAGDSRLIGTTLLQPGTTTADVAGPLAVTLEPGWYAITVGIGRYGATASTWATTVPNVCATWPCPTQAGQTVGPYTVNATTNARSLQGTTVRIFARGQTLPPSPPAATAFLVESARPSAWKSTQTSGMVSPGRAVAVRFTIDRAARARRVGAWMFSGAGNVYAAIVRIPGPTANAPFPGTAAFTNALVGSAVFDVGNAVDEYGADLPDLALAPGAYALVIGSGLFGASGSALMQSVVDQIVIDDASLWNSQWGPFWAPATPTDHYNVRLTGIVPELSAEAIAFGDVPLGVTATRTVTVRNLRAGDLHLGGIALAAGSETAFGLDADVAACAGTTVPALGQCTFSLHFTPDALGAHAAQVEVESDGVPATFAVAASGSGIPAWIVTPAAGVHGSIAPATPQIVGAGATLAFTLTPDDGYHVDTVGGSCGGTLAGNVYTIAAASADCTVEASFALDPPTAFAPVGGSPQSAEVDAVFAAPLQVRVANAAGIGVPGVTVSFTVPASGASALVAASSTTGADGVASVEARANTIAGDYAVTAAVAGLAGAASFQLHNEAGAPVQLAVAAGTPQSAVVDSDFAQPLAVRVTDAHDNPVGGVAVAFAAPASGASAIVAASAPTGADGIAQVDARANTVAGSYTVTASSPALQGSASFALQNTAGPPAHVVATGGVAQSAVVESAFAEPLALR